MTWLTIATIELTQDWQFTNPVQGSVFRVSHVTSSPPLFRGLICQAYTGGGGPELLGITRLYSKDEKDLYEFAAPKNLSDRRIGVKRSDNHYNPWSVQIEVLEEKPMIPVGAIVQFGGVVAPDGWLICDGSAVSRSDYENLFNAIGTTYGNGDGFNTFNLPDLRGRVPIGAGTGPNLTGRALGQAYGSERVMLGWNNLPFGSDFLGLVSRSSSGSITISTPVGTTHRNLAIGFTGQEAVDKLPPAVAVNYIIKALP